MKNATPNLDWNAYVCWRGLLVVALIVCAFFVWGCTYTRQNAPVQFAPLLNIEVKDSANGNTAPLVGQ